MAGANGVDGGRPVGQAFQDPAEAIRAEADHGDAVGEGISGNDRIPISRGRRGAGTGTSSSNDEAHFTDGDRSAEVMSLEELHARVQGARFEKNSTGSGRHGEEDRRRGGEHHPTQADERQPQRGSVSEGVEEGAISTGEEAGKTERDAGALQTVCLPNDVSKVYERDVFAIGIDMANAFDSFSWNGIRERLRGKGTGVLANIVRNYPSDRRIEYPITRWRTETDPGRETAGVAKLICYGDDTLPITKPQSVDMARHDPDREAVRNGIRAMGILVKIEK
ncbi:UNVERIFIED_CONTAM: hypothetical protein PYX00_006903 [Menopon gallinae]|uniref:Reverse transcriptase domain-containing protein n=1 Tax=Menopon gallinae TaxID=328185 RepID=A0AAW2HWU1_9NEOP